MDAAGPKHAFHEAIAVHHPVGAIGIAVCCVADRVHDTLDAPTLSVAPNGDALRRPFAVDVRGLPVSLRGFL